MCVPVIASFCDGQTITLRDMLGEGSHLKHSFLPVSQDGPVLALVLKLGTFQRMAAKVLPNLLLNQASVQSKRLLRISS